MMKIKKLQIKRKEKQEFDAHTQMFVRSKNISIRNHTSWDLHDRLPFYLAPSLL